MNDMNDKAEAVSKYLKGIASPHRLLLLCSMAEGEKSVTELMEATGLAQSSASQHLAKLREEGAVSYRREHRTLYYSISSKLTQDIMALLHQEFCQNKENINV
jgi:DNA-binding transcriptional ArsR family regulator